MAKFTYDSREEMHGYDRWGHRRMKGRKTPDIKECIRLGKRISLGVILGVFLFFAGRTAAALAAREAWRAGLQIWDKGGQSGAGVQEGRDGQEVKMVALTFDDGPHKKWTPLLLDGLKERGVKATFFLMGENIAGNEDIVRRMAEEGHLIGNHSFRHVQLTKAGMEEVCASFEQTGVIIEELTGSCPQYVRPPYGDWNEELECRTNLTTVLWDVDSLDWKYKNRRRVVNKVCKEVENGDIILMHDIFQSSEEAALEIVDRLSREGWQFVTVDELMID